MYIFHSSRGLYVCLLFGYAIISILSSFEIILTRKRQEIENLFLCFNYLPGVLCLLEFSESSSHCHVLCDGVSVVLDHTHLILAPLKF